MRMRQHNPIPAAPPAIDFSELQLKNFNHQYNMFVKENKGSETLSVNVKDQSGYQVQSPPGYADP